MKILEDSKLGLAVAEVVFVEMNIVCTAGYLYVSMVGSSYRAKSPTTIEYFTFICEMLV